MSQAVSFLLGAVLAGTLTALGLVARARARYADLPSFRCRVGRPPARRRRRRSRWRSRRTRAAWVDDVLLIRSGALGLWLTPVAASVVLDVEVRAVHPSEAPGLGPRPVVLTACRPVVGRLEIAAAAEDAGRLVGPYLAAMLSDLPDTRFRRPG
jgi:hypothetical protein